ncbi:hypothetical protein VP01_1609g1 [Puccinia sorghi]|uniref:Uncharacterized protein n=1 Tax=Puccinia sorghi TaxID=27349 RepID=A0A0L6VHR4_9BASI|nr:hypothetical protein VP01_1609g1 [Puccinia sorghi]
MRIINEENPHVLKAHCALNVFNLIEKRIASHPRKENFVKGNKTLVNYFSMAGFWREHLSTWRNTKTLRVLFKPSYARPAGTP